MCRLFAVRAARPFRVERAFTTLQAQSHEHKDGWGIAAFDGPLAVERGLESAHASGRFGELGRLTETRHLLAHIRLASVGGVSLQNAHPFVAGGWAFMHNGTVHRFEKHRERLEGVVSPRRLREVQGETDSELCLALFLTHLDAIPRPRLGDVARVLAQVMHQVTTLVDHHADQKPSALNFLASDGNLTFATRRGRSLHLLRSADLVAVGSEPLWEDARWAELAEDAVVAIDEQLAVHEFTVQGLLTL